MPLPPAVTEVPVISAVPLAFAISMPLLPVPIEAFLITTLPLTPVAAMPSCPATMSAPLGAEPVTDRLAALSAMMPLPPTLICVSETETAFLLSATMPLPLPAPLVTRLLLETVTSALPFCEAMMALPVPPRMVESATDTFPAALIKPPIEPLKVAFLISAAPATAMMAGPAVPVMVVVAVPLPLTVRFP